MLSIAVPDLPGRNVLPFITIASFMKPLYYEDNIFFFYQCYFVNSPKSAVIRVAVALTVADQFSPPKDEGHIA